MSDIPVPAEIVSPQFSTPQSSSSLRKGQFDLTQARPFIYKSISEETRAAYTRAIREFFNFMGEIHPNEVTPAHVINYRDHLRINKRRKANTVATKLAIGLCCKNCGSGIIRLSLLSAIILIGHLEIQFISV
jgi:hypothetical protein